MDNSLTLKKFYSAVILIAFALAMGTYIFFATEVPVYTARGKFTYFFNTGTDQITNAPFTSDTFTKSISDSIETRSFLEKLYQETGIKFSSRQANKPDEYISSSVVTGSNVIQVNLFSTDRDSLGKLSLKFFQALNESSIISGTMPRPSVSIVDPIYTEPGPSYPKPLEYAGLVFIGSLLVGIMFLYIFSNNES